MPKKSKMLENKYINLDDREYDLVKYALDQRELAGTAKIVRTYETRLAAEFNSKHALTVSSGTAALHLLLIMLGIKPGDEVMLPPTAPIMTVLPIIAVGARPVFVDIQADSFGLDPEDTKRKLTPNTRAVITVPMWGYPTDLTPIKQLTIAHGIPLIEDASHAHGAMTGNAYVGTLADISFFSTQERKLICTGEGGFILTDNDLYADMIREVRDFGKPVRQTPKLTPHLGQYGYLFGLNFRISALSAALGMAQIEKLKDKIATRTQNAAEIRERTLSVDWIAEWKVLQDTRPNYYSIVFKVDTRKDVKILGKTLFENGVVSDIYRFDSKPLYELPLLAQYKSECPNAAEILSSIITLPTHEGLSKADIQKVTDLIKGY